MLDNFFAPLLLAYLVFVPLGIWLRTLDMEGRPWLVGVGFALFILSMLVVLGGLGLHVQKGGGFGEGMLAVFHLSAVVVLAIVYTPLWVGEFADRVSKGLWMSTPNEIAPIYAQAEAADKAGNPEKAKALFREGIVQYPKDPVPWVRLADIHCKLGEYPLAVDCLKESRNRTKDPQEWADGTFRIAEILARRLGKVREAEGELQEILRRHPKHPCAMQAKKRIALLPDRPGSESTS